MTRSPAPNSPPTAEPRTTHPATVVSEAERPGLTRQRILDAALELVDAEGLEALSMRRLGAHLGVEAMSLYHHFPSKAALLDGLVALLLGAVPLPDPGEATWEQALVRGFADFRQVMLAHPNAFPLVCSRPVGDAESLAPIALAFAVLAAAGFNPSETRTVWCALLSYALGCIECEVTGVGIAVRKGAMVELIRSQEGPAFEALRAAWSGDVLEEWSDDLEYTRGLEALLAGFRLQLSERGPAHP